LLNEQHQKNEKIYSKYSNCRLNNYSISSDVVVLMLLLFNFRCDGPEYQRKIQ